ncbi:hypothetical protein D3C84_949900 [compost metagenome]
MPVVVDPAVVEALEVAAEQVLARILPVVGEGPHPHRVAATVHAGADSQKHEFRLLAHHPVEAFGVHGVLHVVAELLDVAL